MSDRALADRVRDGGDEAAFRVLYRRHTPAVYAFVLRVVGGDQAEAEDVVQDTWLRAARALPGFAWRSSLRTWLTGIALNRARELMRRRARRSGVGLFDGTPAVAAPRAGEHLDLERAIERLPDGYRIVLVLHDVEGFSHEEIGERLEIAVGTSRSQLHHARRAMRRLLEPKEESA